MPLHEQMARLCQPLCALGCRSSVSLSEAPPRCVATAVLVDPIKFCEGVDGVCRPDFPSLTTSQLVDATRMVCQTSKISGTSASAFNTMKQSCKGLYWEACPISGWLPAAVQRTFSLMASSFSIQPDQCLADVRPCRSWMRRCGRLVSCG